MTDVKIVVGANFGDEGKGLMADYFCHQAVSQGKKCLNVLTNGGAQRGHTVVTPTGKRHVFKHFGSGTFAGADTYLLKSFILNPMEFIRELNEFRANEYRIPDVFVDPRCRWTTPYDMLINQIVEECRDQQRHGSCGMGIWETIKRWEGRRNDPSNLFFVFASLPYDDQVKYLKSVRNQYMPEVLKTYGIKNIPLSWRSIVNAPELIDHFIADVRQMSGYVKQYPVTFGGIHKRYDTVVFENGQGLLLDQNRTEYGDNTTPSCTGVCELTELLTGLPLSGVSLEACYVTRTYMTRHGAGLFKTECDKSSLFHTSVSDVTNQTNQFQGALRYGELLLNPLMNRIRMDSLPLQGLPCGVKLSVAVTHADERQFDYFDLHEIADAIYISDGPCRTNISVHTEND